MSFILNEYDVDYARNRAVAPTSNEKPNLIKAAAILARLVEWTNQNSDGWAYWAKPANASAALQQAVKVRTPALVHYAALRVDDIPEAELKAALRTVKAFLTRQRVDADVRRRILGEVA